MDCLERNWEAILAVASFVIPLFLWFLRHRWGRPMIAFGEPLYKKERFFGLVVRIPITNKRRKGVIGMIIPRRLISSCAIRGIFMIGAEVVAEYDWDDPILLTEISGSYIELAVKKQGCDWCGITSVPTPEQRLPQNSSTIVRLSVIGRDQDWAEYVIHNYGDNEADLMVTRLKDEGR